MKILYLSFKRGTNSYARSDALRRLGHDVTNFNIREHLKGRLYYVPDRFISAWIFHTGAWGLEKVLEKTLIRSKIWNNEFDLMHVDQIATVPKSLIRKAKNKYGCVSCFVNDNPFVNKDKRRWRLFLSAITEYDLVTVVRKGDKRIAKQLGAQNVIMVYMGADEIKHRKRSLTDDEKKKYESDVVFIGRYFPERGPMLKKLIDKGVPVKIWGKEWNKSDYWDTIKEHWQGGFLKGDEYVKTLQCAKVCLCFLSVNNNDQYTTRSIEIPLCESVLCARRTQMHVDMFKEGKEAVFWSDIEECAEKCFYLLENPTKRKAIAKNGKRRVEESGYLNEDIMKKIVSEVRNICYG